MTWDRNSPPQGGGSIVNNSGNTTTTTTGPTTTTTGPSTSTNSQTSRSNSTTSESSVNTIREATLRDIRQVVRTQNMDPTSLAALQELIASLGAGGTPEQQAMASELMAQINSSGGAVGDYSKGAAFNDATRVAAAESERALREMMPTITAGIDAAGTSGSAMSALLAQDAAKKASDLAAQLSLDTAIQYGQIQNQARANTVALVGQLTDLRNRTVDQLIGALNIARGAVTEQTTDTRERGSRSATETRNSVSSTSGSQTSTSTQLNSGGTVTNSGGTNTVVSGPSTTVTTPTGTGNNSGTQSSLSTPSSYSANNRINPYITVV